MSNFVTGSIKNPAAAFNQYNMGFNITPTNFEIGPSVQENTRPIVTEEIIDSQAEYISSLNHRVDPLKSYLTQTDFDQLVMTNLFRESCEGTTPIAHFELFISKLPKNRNFMILSGLQDALHWMMNAKMDEDRIKYVIDQPIIRDSNCDKKDFADYLRNFRFKLDVWSQDEGSFYMPTAPYIGVSGPIEQALMFKTYLLSALNSRSAFSTRGAQYKLANPRMNLLAMEMRGMNAELSEVVSYELWKQGFIATSDTEAGYQWNPFFRNELTDNVSGI